MEENLRNFKHTNNLATLTKKLPRPSHTLTFLARGGELCSWCLFSQLKDTSKTRSSPLTLRGRPGVLRLTSPVSLANRLSAAFTFQLAILTEAERAVSPELPVASPAIGPDGRVGFFGVPKSIFFSITLRYR